MRKAISLTPHSVPALTTMDWYRRIAGQLGASQSGDGGLLGVDIGHVDVPGLTVSEACAGFVDRPDGVTATCLLFRDREQVAYDTIDRIVRGSAQPAKTVHQALNPQRPQVNTLIFRDFTLSYSFDLSLPFADLATSFAARLVLHESATSLRTQDLHDRMQAALDAFVSVHENIEALRLQAPDTADLSDVLASMAA